MTTKIELPFRDRWAVLLHKSLKKQDFTILREWMRTDITILKNNGPVALIELKAMYSFDAALDKFADNIHGFANYMLSDEKKAAKVAKKHGNKNTEIYTVLLMTHPLREIPPELDRKYSGINRAFRKVGDSNEILNKATANVTHNLKGRNIIASGSLDGGSVFGVGVNIMYWVVRAKNLSTKGR